MVRRSRSRGPRHRASPQPGMKRRIASSSTSTRRCRSTDWRPTGRIYSAAARRRFRRGRASFCQPLEQTPPRSEFGCEHQSEENQPERREGQPAPPCLSRNQRVPGQQNQSERRHEVGRSAQQVMDLLGEAPLDGTSRVARCQRRPDPGHRLRDEQPIPDLAGSSHGGVGCGRPQQREGEKTEGYEPEGADLPGPGRAGCIEFAYVAAEVPEVALKPSTAIDGRQVADCHRDHEAAAMDRVGAESAHRTMISSR